MQIFYGNNQIEKQCTDYKKATKKFGSKAAKGLLKAINFIESASSLDDVIQYRSYCFHRLQGDKKHLCSIDIDGRNSKWRLYLVPCDINCHSLIEEYFEKRFEILHIELKEVKDHG